jgi:hypothetical protein
MAVLGRRTLAEAERYTRDADNARLAGAAIARLEGLDSQTVTTRFGALRQKPKEISVSCAAMALPRGLEPLFSP